MSRQSSPEVEEARDEYSWSSGYAASRGVVERPDAIRVEQGEYAVTSASSSIGVVGTYNVEQCRVVYAVNPNTSLHGIAHVDGHTEVSSLGKFFEELSGNKSDIKITLLGSTSRTISGLNNSRNNIAKVDDYLRYAGFKADQIYSEETRHLKDFVIDASGTISEGIATHGVEDRPLSVLPEVKRQGGWLGTYSLSRATDAIDSTILLDQRAIVQLKEYERNPEKDRAEGIRDPRDTTDYRLYDESIPKVIDLWNASVDEIMEMNSNSKIDPAELREMIKSTPIHIGEGSDTKNTPVVDIMNSSATLEELQTRLLSQTQNTSTILDAIKIAKRFDHELDEAKILSDITKSYNDEHGTRLTPQQISNKSYGAEIRIETFNDILSENSPTLKALMILNSQGGYSSSTRKAYSLKEAFEAADIFHKQDVLHRAIDTFNESLSIKPSEDDIKQAFDFGVAKLKLTINSKDQQRLAINLQRISTEDNLRDNIERILPKTITDKKGLLDEICNKLDKIVSEEVLKTKKSIKYNAVQSEFLEEAEIPVFSDLTISEELAKRNDVSRETIRIIDRTHDLIPFLIIKYTNNYNYKYF
jgi:hypothetical protein